MGLSCGGRKGGPHGRVSAEGGRPTCLLEAGATAAVATNEDVVPVSALREAPQRIRELERLLGKKQMEIEILQAARAVVKNSPWLRKGSAR